jgi:hypothetical protein
LDESEEENTSDIDESGKLYFFKKIKNQFCIY